MITSGLVAGSAAWYRDTRQELKAAGVKYQDCDVVADGNLASSRQPADMPAFVGALFRIMGLLR